MSDTNDINATNDIRMMSDNTPGDAAKGSITLRPEERTEIGRHIEAIRELIGQIVPGSLIDDAAEPVPTIEAFISTSQRLGRLLALAGMSDGIRAAATLERAGEHLPSDESFKAIDASLTYLRLRLLDVALSETAETAETAAIPAIPAASAADEVAMPNDEPVESQIDAMPDASLAAFPAAEHASSETVMVGDAAEADANGADDATPPYGASETDDGADDGGMADTRPMPVGMLFGVDSGADELGEFDVSPFSDNMQALIRGFQGATLRQREPGEIIAPPVRPTHEISDEIPEFMRRDFLAEAANDLNDLRTLIASFGRMPGSLDDLHAMTQLGHKVKGTAATYEFPVLAEILHQFELVPIVLKPVAVSHGDECLSILIGYADVIEAAIREASIQQDASPARLDEAKSLVAAAEARASYPQQSPPAATSPSPAIDATYEDESAGTTNADTISDRSTAYLPSIHRGGEEDYLRVEPRQLDTLLHQADGLAMNRAMLAESSEEIFGVQSDVDNVLARLTQLSSKLSELQSSVGTPSASPDAGASGSRLVVSRQNENGGWENQEVDSTIIVDESLRKLSEAVSDATTLSGNLRDVIQRLTRNSDDQRTVLRTMQQTIIHLRLVSLKSLADRITLAAHQVAHTEGKKIQMKIVGQATEIDRNICDALIPVIVQLVRNAVAHGIESPGEREAQGKPATGKIWFRASYSGNEVNIEVGDDGRGVNPNQLMAAAVATRDLDAKHAEYLTRDQRLRLMFEPNLSTAEQASVISGHGIGLDGVLTAIQRLRGSITPNSEQGRGTIFQIRVPITLSITRALRVRVATDEYAIPLSMIRQMISLPEAGILVSLPDAGATSLAARFPRRVRIARSAPEQPLRLPDDPMATLYDEVPVFSLAELLGLEESPKTQHAALLVDAGQRRVAILVDEVLEDAEVVIRALPPHLSRRAIRGASVMSDGRLFLVLDLPDLLADALVSRPVPHPSHVPPRQHAHDAPKVLVVDDSISMRRALDVMCTSAGYEVQVARDGVEALGMMLEEPPDALILDIEMPRLDGFELLSIIRANETLAKVPVLMLTSRAAEQHHRHALELGARGYLTKPCPDDVLIGALQRMLRERQIQS